MTQKVKHPKQVTLKPCPFCGGTAYLDTVYTKTSYVVCENDMCNTFGPIAGDPVNAVAKWNRRTPTKKGKV